MDGIRTCRALRGVVGTGVVGAAFALVAALVASGAIGAPALVPFSQAEAGAALPDPWRHRPLPKVARENRFELVQDGGRTVLQVRSEASASTLAHPLAVVPAQTPLLSWRWKVSNVVEGSDFTRKSGDDYAARVYVIFDYPLDRLSLSDRLAVMFARTVSGPEVPSAAIAYVWGNAQPAGAAGPNPYTDRAHMIVVNSGAARVGEWVEVRRDVAADFRAAFGDEAPPIVGIAVGADTDNTGESVTARFGDFRFLPRE